MGGDHFEHLDVHDVPTVDGTDCSHDTRTTSQLDSWGDGFEHLPDVNEDPTNNHHRADFIDDSGHEDDDAANQYSATSRPYEDQLTADAVVIEPFVVRSAVQQHNAFMDSLNALTTGAVFNSPGSSLFGD